MSRVILKSQHVQSQDSAETRRAAAIARSLREEEDTLRERGGGGESVVYEGTSYATKRVVDLQTGADAGSAVRARASVVICSSSALAFVCSICALADCTTCARSLRNLASSLS